MKQSVITLALLVVLTGTFSCKKNSNETTLSITGISADTAWIGKPITVYGSGFSLTPSDNIVRIGNTVIDIIETAATELTFKVPADAVSGKVSVSVKGIEQSLPTQLFITNQLVWQKTLGGFTNDKGSALAIASDGGYLIAGSTRGQGGDVGPTHGLDDFWVVKMKADLTIAWEKAIGGTGYDQAQCIVALADGGCVVAGYTNSNDGDVTGNHGDNDYFIVKLDAGGNIIWKTVLGGSGNDQANALVAISGGFVVAGSTSSPDGDVTGNHGGADYWVVWLDTNGTLVNQKTYGGTDHDLAKTLVTTKDGGYLVAGRAASNNEDVKGNHGGDDFWVLKLTALGNVEWQKTIGGTKNESAYAIISASDGGCFIAGDAESSDGDVTGNQGGSDYWVVKLNSTGNIVWQKSLGGSRSDVAHGIVAAKDGGCAVAGNTSSSDGDITRNQGRNDNWIVRLNKTGSLVWQKTLGGTLSDAASGIVTTGNSFVAVGYTNSDDGDISGLHSYGEPDFWLYKILD